MISPRVKERLGAGLAALAFLFAFGGVGLAASYVIYGTVRDGIRAQDWVAVRATVNRVDQGTVAYTYEWQGKVFTGDRAGTFILGGTSDVDDWDDRMEAAIGAAQEEKKPLMVFVNPGNPAESMVNREIRWKLLLFALPFALGFGVGGLAAFFLIGRDALPPRGSARKAEAYAGSGVPLLRPRAREALTQWVVGLVWNGVSLPIALVAIPGLWSEGSYFPIVLLALFPFFGLLILWSAVGSTMSAFREGLFNTSSARSA
jgi:hypothetical protein